MTRRSLSWARFGFKCWTVPRNGACSSRKRSTREPTKKRSSTPPRKVASTCGRPSALGNDEGRMVHVCRKVNWVRFGSFWLSREKQIAEPIGTHLYALSPPRPSPYPISHAVLTTCCRGQSLLAPLTIVGIVRSSWDPVRELPSCI